MASNTFAISIRVAEISYDIDDPDELVNLTDNPEYASTMSCVNG